MCVNAWWMFDKMFDESSDNASNIKLIMIERKMFDENFFSK